MVTIGKIAKQAGVGVETIRFYEREGLIKQPKKAVNQGFRLYQLEDAQKVRFIKRAQELGFTLKEVKELLKLNSSRQATCEDVRLKAEAKREEIEAKIADLERMKKSLKAMELACRKSPEMVACCKIEACFDGRCE